MKNKIELFIKRYEIAYIVYNRLFSLTLRVLGIFVRTNDKLILFNSFGGAKYDDSPKAIYEYMLKNGKYSSFTMIWGLDKLPKNAPKNIKWVKNNTIKYFITALKAKYWITNSSIERGLKFKKRQTICINTWHGSALKKMGADTGKDTKKIKASKSDIFYCQSEYDKQTFSRAFRLPKSCMRIVGLPRNDELAKATKEKIEAIRNKLKISRNKKIILYAPTFRDYAISKDGNIIAPPINIAKWRRELSKEYVVLFRAHYEVGKVLNVNFDSFIIDATKYENLNELMIASDILVSDYSSIMIDYSILERPIFGYCYDLEEYEEKRGLYFDLNKTLPNGVQKTEDELIEKILHINKEEQKKRTRKFKKKFVEEYGHASEYIDKIIK